MQLHLTIVPFDDAPFPPGSNVKVEIRDTALQDAPAILLQQVALVVPKTGHTTEVTVTSTLAAVPDGTTVWVHVDVDRDGRVGKGDYVTVESYPVKDIRELNLVIRVKRVT